MRTIDIPYLPGDKVFFILANRIQSAPVKHVHVLITDFPFPRCTHTVHLNHDQSNAASAENWTKMDGWPVPKGGVFESEQDVIDCLTGKGKWSPVSAKA